MKKQRPVDRQDEDSDPSEEADERPSGTGLAYPPRARQSRAAENLLKTESHCLLPIPEEATSPGDIELPVEESSYLVRAGPSREPARSLESTASYELLPATSYTPHAAPTSGIATSSPPSESCTVTIPESDTEPSFTGVSESISAPTLGQTRGAVSEADSRREAGPSRDVSSDTTLTGSVIVRETSLPTEDDKIKDKIQKETIFQTESEVGPRKARWVRSIDTDLEDWKAQVAPSMWTRKLIKTKETHDASMAERSVTQQPQDTVAQPTGQHRQRRRRALAARRERHERDEQHERHERDEQHERDERATFRSLEHGDITPSETSQPSAGGDHAPEDARRLLKEVTATDEAAGPTGRRAQLTVCPNLVSPPAAATPAAPRDLTDQEDIYVLRTVSFPTTNVPLLGDDSVDDSLEGGGGAGGGGGGGGGGLMDALRNLVPASWGGRPAGQHQEAVEAGSWRGGTPASVTHTAEHMSAVSLALEEQTSRRTQRRASPRHRPRRDPATVKRAKPISSKKAIKTEDHDPSIDEKEVEAKVEVKDKPIPASDDSALDDSAPDDSAPDAPQSTPAPPPSTKKDEASLFFLDGKRRVDYVLVLPREEKAEAREQLTDDLAESGLQTEPYYSEKHKKLIFLKLHATDLMLDQHASGFGVSREFRNTHLKFFVKKPVSLLGDFYRFYQEPLWLANIRESYSPPVKMSPFDRSYVVHMFLTLGSQEKTVDLPSLLREGVVLDAFAPHDGPLEPPPTVPQEKYSARQILKKHWASWLKIIKGQPTHILHEYFGPKVAFYFTFYEFYNKFLLVAALWGLVMMLVVYKGYDSHYMGGVRRSYDVYDMPSLSAYNAKEKAVLQYLWVSTPACGECEGANQPDVCPYTHAQDYCYDMKILSYFDSPFIVVYSAGISFLMVLFLYLWRRTEEYWWWLTEGKSVSLVLPNYKSRNLMYYIKNLPHWSLFDLLLPFCVILLPVVLTLALFVSRYDSLRSKSVSVERYLVDKSEASGAEFPIPRVHKPTEYAVLWGFAVLLQMLLYAVEKGLHVLIPFAMKFENYKTYADYEQSLILAHWWTSLHYITPIVVFFAMFKGSFYFSPVSYWSPVLNVTMPWGTHSRVLSDGSFLQRAFSLNCGYFSCFAQGVIALLAVLFVRLGLATIVEFVYSIVMAVVRRAEVMKCCGTPPPGYEQEYHLPAVSAATLVADMNTLVLQMVLVVLFAPLFPLAPLIAFIINIWDLRLKARKYLMRSRRVMLQTTKGVGTWNQALRVLCYALPLVHGIIVCRTEVFRWLVFWHASDLENVLPPAVTAASRQYDNELVDNHKFIFLFGVNFFFYGNAGAIVEHKKFVQASGARAQLSADGADLDKFGTAGTGWRPHLAHCRANGFFYPIIKEKQPWPYELNAIVEEGSWNAATADHYRWMAFKALYVLVFAVCAWVCGGAVSRAVWRHSTRVWGLRARERAILQPPLSLVRGRRPLPPLPPRTPLPAPDDSPRAPPPRRRSAASLAGKTATE